ncbi:MAG: hypothetical protein ABL984_13545 [Pyrinomonadaceae bacterium]
MNSSKYSANKRTDLTILAIVIIAIIVLLATQTIFAQIKVGGIKVDGINLPTKKDKGGAKGAKSGNENQGGATGTTSPDQGTDPQGSKDDPPEWFVNVMVGDMRNAQEDVDSYTPEGKIYLVRSPLAPWLLRAVSQKAREAFAIDKKFQDWRKANLGNKYDTGLDALAAAAAKKLPAYIPGPKNFAFRDAAMEKMMKDKLKNFSTLKVHKIGLFHSAWIIEKDSLGFPANRYREAYIWARDSADDHPYCHLYGFVVQQDYAGGGTYGATGVIFNTDALFGCPTK